MSTTDNQSTNRSHKSAKKEEKMRKITKLARKLQATADMMNAGLHTFGAKLALIHVTSNKHKKETGWV